MTSDELHEDHAEVPTYDFVCTNRKCEHYEKARDLPVRRGTTEPIDWRDLECDCGVELVAVDSQIEWVDPDTRRRYLAVQAVTI